MKKSDQKAGKPAWGEFTGSIPADFRNGAERVVKRVWKKFYNAGKLLPKMRHSRQVGLLFSLAGEFPLSTQTPLNFIFIYRILMGPYGMAVV